MVNIIRLGFSFALIFVLFQSCQQNPYQQGRLLYLGYCSSCHMEDGQGLKLLIPPLSGSDFLKNNPDKTACIIRQGLNEPIVVNGKNYDQPMDPIPSLNDVEISNIINYIHHAWGNDLAAVRLPDVQAALKQGCPDAVTTF